MIWIEAKGYGATGSKMTNVVGDIDAIIDAKRPDTTLLFFTDGVRQSDLKKLVDRQNNGEIARIYTREMSEQFEMDLRTLKAQYHISSAHTEIRNSFTATPPTEAYSF